MKSYLDKQGLDTLATELKKKFVPTPALGQPESILTLDKNKIIRWDNLIGVLKYKGLLNSTDELPSADSAKIGDIFGIVSSSAANLQQTLYILVYRQLEGDETTFQKQWVPIQSSEDIVKSQDLVEITEEEINQLFLEI